VTALRWQQRRGGGYRGGDGNYWLLAAALETRAAGVPSVLR